MKRFLSLFFLSLGIGFILVSCANRGNPSGGEKDIDPPVIVKSEPENFSTDFNSKEIKIYFDEYVKIKDLQKHLIISPPMTTQPEITPLGSASKYIKIKINDTLRANTTYAFNFGESIVDNNEGNPYPYYKYIFSTGNFIDSLKVSGTVKDAYAFKTDDFISVGLYEMDSTFTDSIIYKAKPKYITSTLDSTSFELQNLKAGKYMMVAFKEKNTDYIFQPKTDKIGFIKEAITIPTENKYELKMYNEQLDFKVVRPKLIAGQKIMFPFEGKPSKDLKINLISTNPENYKYNIVKDLEKDSLYYYYTPKIESDSLLFTVTNKTYVDTFTVRMKEQKLDSLTFKAYPNGTINFNEIFEIGANTPLSKINTKKITLINKDSVAVPFTNSFDKIKNRYQFSFDKIEQERYSMQLLPGALTDLFEQQNDTLNYQISTKTESDYGNIRLTLKNAKYPLLVELIGDKSEKIATSYYITKPEPIDLRFVLPGKYYIRVIHDTNKNEKYDAGNYLKQLQPERVSFYPKLLEIRAGWDEIIEFELLD